VEVKVAPLGIPCEPGEPSPLPPGIPFVCPPVEEQGVLVFLKASGEQVQGYRTRLKYTAADGSERESVQVIGRSQVSPWTVEVFRIGRMRTERLPGVKVNEVEAQALDSLDSAQPDKAAAGKK